jgi:hypothetical protein
METGEASGWLAPIAELDSDVSFKMNFHKNAIHDYAGISNALQCVIQEKHKMQQERDGKCCCVCLDPHIVCAIILYLFGPRRRIILNFLL